MSDVHIRVGGPLANMQQQQQGLLQLLRQKEEVINKLREENVHLNNEHLQAQNRLTELHQIHTQSQDKHSFLKEQIEQTASTMLQLQTANQQKTEHIHHLQGKCDTYENTISNLQKQLSSVENQLKERTEALDAEITARNLHRKKMAKREKETIQEIDSLKQENGRQAELITQYEYKLESLEKHSKILQKGKDRLYDLLQNERLINKQMTKETATQNNIETYTDAMHQDKQINKKDSNQHISNSLHRSPSGKLLSSQKTNSKTRPKCNTQQCFDQQVYGIKSPELQIASTPNKNSSIVANSTDNSPWTDPSNNTLQSNSCIRRQLSKTDTNATSTPRRRLTFSPKTMASQNVSEQSETHQADNVHSDETKLCQNKCSKSRNILSAENVRKAGTVTVLKRCLQETREELHQSNTLVNKLQRQINQLKLDVHRYRKSATIKTHNG